MKSAEKDMNLWLIIAAIHTTLAVEKNFSYIRLHSSPSTGLLRTHNVTSSKWPDTSVGRALHRYRRGHGFESRLGLNFFTEPDFQSQYT